MKKNNKYSLHTLFLEVTSRCNALCDHCGSSCTNNVSLDLSPIHFKKVLDDIAANYDRKSIMVNITGGEPLMRKDLFEITGYADKLGFKWGLVTNGMLITDDIIQKMKDTHMSTITISLDGMKKTHEEFRHVPGSFDKIINAISKIKASNFLEHIQVTFIATKNNINELAEVHEMLSSLNIDSLRISGVDPIGRANDNKNLLLDADDYHYLFQMIDKHANSKLPIVWSCTHYFGNTNYTLDPSGKKFKCATGINIASVLSNGDIFGCPNIPRRKELIQGNILKDNFCDIWDNKFEFFRNPDRLKSSLCNNCEFWENCKGDCFHTFDFNTNTPLFCFKNIFTNNINVYRKSEITYDNIMEMLLEKNGSMKYTTINPTKGGNSEIVIFTPQATRDLFSYFHYGEYHPSNLYEQQVGLIGNKINNISLIKFIVPSILYNRSNNMATMDNASINHILSEVDIINENMQKSDKIYKDLLGEVSFLGFAHSHPNDTSFKFSINDTKNHNLFTNEFGFFVSIIINPQKKKIVCFSGEECYQSKLVLLTI